MARKKLVEVETPKNQRSEHLSQLSVLVKQWGEKKQELDPLKKSVDKDAAEIKQIMIAEELDESTSAGFTASLTYQTKESFDIDNLLAYLKNNVENGASYVRTVEEVDWDALEKAVYNGTISKEQILEIDKFKTVTKTSVLKLKTRKE